MAKQYPRFGYLILHGLLRVRKLVQNRKRTYRLCIRSSVFRCARSAGKSCIARVFRCLCRGARTSAGRSASCTTSLVMRDAFAC